MWILVDFLPEKIRLSCQANRRATAAALWPLAQLVDGLLNREGVGVQQIGAIRRVVGNIAGQGELGGEMDGQVAAGNRRVLARNEQFGFGVLDGLRGVRCH